MAASIPFDIAIIGDGLTGLSLAYHLQKQSDLRIALCGTYPQSLSASELAAGFACEGLMDNYSRFVHAHGEQLSQELWFHTRSCYQRFKQFLSEHQLPFQEGLRRRWAVDEHECIEMQHAAAQLQKAGFRARLYQSHQSSQVRMTQEDGTYSLAVTSSELMMLLRQQFRGSKFGKVLRFTDGGARKELSGEDFQIEAQVVVFCCHLAIGDFLPFFREVLVPYADQWAEFTVAEDVPLPIGSLFSWQHGHHWGHRKDRSRLTLGGARFLRPLAGIEAKSAPYEEKIEHFLQEAWQKLWPAFPLQKLRSGEAFRDIWPCDELPLVGPVFGDGQLLVAAGWMGTGLSLAFGAGADLANLILGLPQQLPRSLWPERLRSLPPSEGA